jgi:hypothetical protein
LLFVNLGQWSGKFELTILNNQTLALIPVIGKEGYGVVANL